MVTTEEVFGATERARKKLSEGANLFMRRFPDALIFKNYLTVDAIRALKYAAMHLKGEIPTFKKDAVTVTETYIALLSVSEVIRALITVVNDDAIREKFADAFLAAVEVEKFFEAWSNNENEE